MFFLSLSSLDDDDQCPTKKLVENSEDEESTDKSIAAEIVTPYEQACSESIDDLYHMAYIAFVNTADAEDLVVKTCVSGVHKYYHMKDVAKIRYRLTSNLYRCAKKKLRTSTPDSHTLPEPLQVLTKHERLLIALRFSSGLPATVSGRIAKISASRYRKTISDIMRKIPLTK